MLTGLGATAAATIGLRLLRKGNPVVGASLLAGSAAIALLLREPAKGEPAD